MTEPGPRADLRRATGGWPLVHAERAALAMAMAGRTAYCDELDGDSVATLRDRRQIS